MQSRARARVDDDSDHFELLSWRKRALKAWSRLFPRTKTLAFYGSSTMAFYFRGSCVGERMSYSHFLRSTVIRRRQIESTRSVVRFVFVSAVLAAQGNVC